MEKEQVIIIDFGGHYSATIARITRKKNIYCEVMPYDADFSTLTENNVSGIILTGDINYDVNDEKKYLVDHLFDLNVPVLAIGYGMDLIAAKFGMAVNQVRKSIESNKKIDFKNSNLFKNIEQNTEFYFDKINEIIELKNGFISLASLENQTNISIMNDKMKIYGVAFHPEREVQTEKIIENFLFNICECEGKWNMGNYTAQMIQEIKEKVGDKKVLLALSGGVDSTVCAVLISKAIGKKLTCILVDHGLMRKNEANEVQEVFKTKYDVNFIKIDAQERFYSKLAGVTDPEKKRKIIGEEFIRVFEEESKKLGSVDFFAQGTIYPDIIESGIGKGEVIKSHHNVGGLPEHVDFKELLEPLKMLFKDEVRAVGLELGIPHNLVFRQPFPGPGIGVRILGEITAEKAKTLQDADKIFRDEIEKANLNNEISQYFAALADIKAVGVKNGKRTYGKTIVLRAIKTIDFMTAEVAELPYAFLNKCMSRIINEVDGVNRVVYDITSKPPGTIEWE